MRRYLGEDEFRVWLVPGTGLVRIEDPEESDQPGPGDKPPMSRTVVQELIRIEDVRSAHTIEYPTQPEPLASLPSRVVAPRGKLTLYADYADIWQGQVVLYVVNRTQQPVRLPAQDGDLYVKLEVLADSGRWQRAQRHEYSTCGNSYHQAVLGPGQYISLLGWANWEGARRKVRYRFYSDIGIASNAAFTLVSDRAIEEARNDRMRERTSQ